jgi:uncharacterized RDD family membrane protein YckC
MPCKNHPLVEESLSWCARCGEQFCPNCLVTLGGYRYCAACKQETLGNLRAGVPAVGPDLASVGKRFGALFLDGLIVNVPLVVILGIVMFMVMSATFPPNARQPGNPMAIFAVEMVGIAVVSAAGILYEGLMLSRGGQTLGKKAMRIKVVSAAGGEVSTGQAFGRAVMRKVLGFVPCLGLVDYLMAFGDQRSCIHDLTARTRVINWDS